jgi:hypothetical protein
MILAMMIMTIVAYVDKDYTYTSIYNAISDHEFIAKKTRFHIKQFGLSNMFLADSPENINTNHYHIYAEDVLFIRFMKKDGHIQAIYFL